MTEQKRKRKMIKEKRYYHKKHLAIGDENQEIVYVQYLEFNGQPSGWTYCWKFNPYENGFAWSSYMPAFSFTGQDKFDMSDYKIIPKSKGKYISPFVNEAKSYPSKLSKLNK
jgi:glutamine synthetase